MVAAGIGVGDHEIRAHNPAKFPAFNLLYVLVLLVRIRRPLTLTLTPARTWRLAHAWWAGHWLLWSVPALTVCLWIYAGACAGTWLLSVLTRENSWVDRIWSVIPAGYLAVFAGAAGFRDPRLDTLLLLVVLWGARLTFNFARKGGYARGGEDYRWGVLRGRMSRWQFRLFNLFFITLYQNAVLLLICLPALTALEHRTAFGVPDALAAVLFLAFLAGETIADQQQWDFHRFKRAEAAAGHEPRPGFLSTGLFRYSRHPNFFFEQAQWWVVFAFGAIAARSPWQPTVLGVVLLTLLFVGSTRFTESITRSRYPEYAQYQETTSPVVPWFPKRRPEARMS